MTESDRLKQIIEDDWEWRLREYPTFATYVGDRRYDDRWTDVSREAIERRKEDQRRLLSSLERIDASRLTPSEKLDLDLLLRDTRLEVEGARFPAELMPVTQMGGVHQDLAEIALLAPRALPVDFDHLIARLRAYPLLVQQTIDLMEEGLRQGIVPPRVPLRGTSDAIAAQIATEPEQTPIWSVAFQSLPPTLPAAECARIRRDAKAAIGAHVRPALERLKAFWDDRYYPATRDDVSLSSLPGGREWYEHNVRVTTTTDLTPAAIHEIGLEEVARVRTEMEAIRREVGFDGTLEELLVRLRTDPQFFFEEKEALVVAYRDIAKRIDPELPRLFGTLPRLPYGVVPVPEYSEKTQTTAYYMPGSPQAGRAGYFYANTYDLRSRPRWEMEALTAHEAVPGHHLQIALAQELENVSPFRRYALYTAFVEGWGLYAESLGAELGLYRDPYSRFGQLTYEMWRSVRLVVDTGLHARGWSRERAIEYFRANAGKSEHDIAVEVDRYIVWPAQALAYKIGQLRILELRRLAERELGDAFDIRRFHDAVLLSGPLPLSVLEQRVRDWIEAARPHPAIGRSVD